MTHQPLAHSGGHFLADHLYAVAVLAAEFSKLFDATDPVQRWAYIAGLWHDLGKYRPGFQKYVRQADGENAHIEGRAVLVAGRDKSHSAAGALWVRMLFSCLVDADFLDTGRKPGGSRWSMSCRC